MCKFIAMKTPVLLSLLVLAACGANTQLPDETATPETPVEAEPLSRIELSEAERARVETACDFSFKLLDKVYATRPGSVFISPLSVQYALGMVNNGASGETERQISEVLGAGGRDELNAFCRHLMTDLPRVDPSVDISLANGILLNDEFTLKPAFRQAVEEYYGALVEEMSYADARQVVARVNGWCSEKTRGKIDRIIDDVNPDAILFALNAIYFKGDWALPFDKRNTRDGDFRTASGRTVTTAMMFREDQYPYSENDLFQHVVLPYGNGRFAMEVFLPKASLADVLAYLAATPWATARKAWNETVTVRLPRFSAEYFCVMNDVLSALGMPRAFTNGAEFFDMVERQGAKISRVLHKARIDVDEKGTEAAAVTAVEMAKLTSVAEPEKPKVFNADHPFVYVIRESTSGAILFTGIHTGE